MACFRCGDTLVEGGAARSSEVMLVVVGMLPRWFKLLVYGLWMERIPEEYLLCHDAVASVATNSNATSTWVC